MSEEKIVREELTEDALDSVSGGARHGKIVASNLKSSLAEELLGEEPMGAISQSVRLNQGSILMPDQDNKKGRKSFGC